MQIPCPKCRGLGAVPGHSVISPLTKQPRHVEPKLCDMCETTGLVEAGCLAKELKEAASATGEPTEPAQ